MTVTSSKSKSGPYEGAGTTGPFTVEFRFLDDGHLRVIKTDAEGVMQTLRLGADYSVTGAGSQEGGSVRLSVPLPRGCTLVVLRNVPATQLADYVTSDKFPAESHESALDKVTMLVQQQSEQLGRALTFPESDIEVSGVLPPVAERYNRYLSFDETGKPIASTFTEQTIVDASQNAVARAAEAAQSAADAAASEVAAAGFAGVMIDGIKAATPTIRTFRGDGVTTRFALGQRPFHKHNVEPSISGVLQHVDSYDIDGAFIEFTEPPPAPTNEEDADNIQIKIAPNTAVAVADPSTMLLHTREHGTWPLSEYVQELPQITQPSGNEAAGGFISYAALGAYEGPAANAHFIGDGIAGSIERISEDVPANGVTVFKDGLNRSWRRIFNGRVMARWAGARGNGLTIDDAALERLIDLQLPVDGEGLTYLITTKIVKTVSYFDWVNFKFRLPAVYGNVGLEIICPRVHMDKIYADGGRGTYNTTLEPWTVFTTFLDVPSIQPSISAFLSFTSLREDAVIEFGDIEFENMASHTVVLVQTFGNVFFKKQKYKNCANKTVHVYHSINDGVHQAGSTWMGHFESEDCGILPDNFTVDGVAKTRADNYAPQGAFNCIVSFGDFILESAAVHNYGASGVTPDRNKTFLGGSVRITHDDPKAWSNNPSGAFWDEACDSCALDSLFVEVTARDPRDHQSLFDSSLLQIYKKAGQSFKCGSAELRVPTSGKVTGSPVRLSYLDKNTIDIGSLYVYGSAYGANAMVGGALPGSVIGADVRFGSFKAENKNIELGSFSRLFFGSLDIGAGTILVAPTGNPGITGSVKSLDISGAAAGSLSVNQAMSDFSLSGQSSIGDLNVGARVESVLIRDNIKAGVITAVNVGALGITGNLKLGRVDVTNVSQYVITGNAEIRTAVAAPAVWIHPADAATLKSGVCAGNGLAIASGVSGAGYVSTPAEAASRVVTANNVQVTN